MRKSKKDVKKYAKTFLDIVGIENAPQAISEVNLINDLMVKNKEFKGLLLNPRFTLEEKQNCLSQVASRSGISDKVLRFIVHLMELGLIIHISDVIKAATALYLEKKRRVKAVVKTPIAISKDYEERLRLSLKKLTDRDVDIEYVMDPSLLGGLLIQVGSIMYDTSLKGQLGLLKNQLIRG